jgi:hypothetical protein
MMFMRSLSWLAKVAYSIIKQIYLLSILLGVLVCEMGQNSPWQNVGYKHNI